MAKNPQIYNKVRPTPVGSSPAPYGSGPDDDKYTVIIDGLGSALATAGFTVYKRKAAIIKETDVFPCVIVSPSEEGESTGQMALDAWTEFKYTVKVFYVQKYNRDYAYESQVTRYDIRKAIYKLANVSGMLSPTGVDIRGIPPFNIDDPETTWKVTGFRITYGFFEQGDI